MKNNQKGFSTLLGLLLFIVLAGGGLYLYSEKVSKEMPEVNSVSTTTQKENVITIPKKETPVACTMDAKQCPDGTYIGRTGPDCEFVCPVTPIVRITSPNKEEVWNKNNEYIIHWEYSGLNKNDEVIIGFRNSEQEVCWAGTEIVGNSQFKVTPNKIACDGDMEYFKSGGKYKVQIIVSKYSEGKGVADISDNYITIKNG